MGSRTELPDLASSEAEYVIGTTIVVDGGQILPEGSDFKITPN